MRSLRALILALTWALIMPVVVLAIGPFYTSTDPGASTTSNGLSPADPRRATTQTEWDAALKDFALSLGQGQTATVYWWNVSQSQYCIWTLAKDGTARPGRCLNGSPPGTGVDLTPPLVVGGLAVLGVASLSAAWFLLRRQHRTTGS